MVPVRILIVDDSVVVRNLLCEAFSKNPDVTVAGTAPNGTIALAKIPQINPDVITLDIEMPGMNGIQTLVEIRKLYPKLPVIMFSTLTERGATITMEALSLGASDYATKPTNSGSLADAMEHVRQDLLKKILFLCRKPAPVAAVPARPAATFTGFKPKTTTPKIDILAIGTSTGGPNALAAVIPHLPADFPVPVVIVQHMPPMFTRLLADRLNSTSQLTVRESEPGETLTPGHVWIARGDYHMTVSKQGAKGIISHNQGQPENSCRPAVDVLFSSVAQSYGPNVLGVVMTGMGADGVRGAVQIREAGGFMMIQDEATSVVWGMPGAVAGAGAADKVCPLPEISQEIVRRVIASRV